MWVTLCSVSGADVVLSTLTSTAAFVLDVVTATGELLCDVIISVEDGVAEDSRFFSVVVVFISDDDVTSGRDDVVRSAS